MPFRDLVPPSAAPPVSGFLRTEQGKPLLQELSLAFEGTAFRLRLRNDTCCSGNAAFDCHRICLLGCLRPQSWSPSGERSIAGVPEVVGQLTLSLRPVQ
jgi:hypothetical protein